MLIGLCFSGLSNCRSVFLLFRFNRLSLKGQISKQCSKLVKSRYPNNRK